MIGFVDGSSMISSMVGRSRAVAEFGQSIVESFERLSSYSSVAEPSAVGDVESSIGRVQSYLEAIGDPSSSIGRVNRQSSVDAWNHRDR